MSGGTLSLPATSAGDTPMRRRFSRLRLGDPAVIIMIAASAMLFFLVLYPVGWLFYGSFSYGEHGFVAALFELLGAARVSRAR